ncbi:MULTISPECIES: exonuclease domain-containing protein [unclassified Guyparkeria]|uniref:exonuclease domain-containing protein n=1 Tax=unclassified Guyparkeria TaxID=2626246 RepID=UPI000A8AD7C8|nr:MULTISPECIES: exonuclease domain-containing protein [unclassified Guyparkeria]
MTGLPQPGERIEALASLPAPFDRLAFVDLETTGTRPTRDRITEVAIIPVDQGVVGEPLQSLVDPGVAIPPTITRLTGISDAMVEGAPAFVRLVDAVAERLEGRWLVAHNARFDAGFLRNAFRAAGRVLTLRELCTVKLSRRLDRGERRHNLDSLISRHQLPVGDRHRAMGDCQALPALLARFIERDGNEAVVEALARQAPRASTPPNLDPAILDAMPAVPGTYRFYGEEGALLYVGKSVNLRSRVRAHFAGDHRSDREMRIAQQTHHIDWIETAGEFGALLTEAWLVKRDRPIFNRRLRAQRSLLTWYWDDEADRPPELRAIDEIEPDELHRAHGMFRSRHKGRERLTELAREHGLCPQFLGLESGKGRACFAHQIGACRGLCAGAEPEIAHRLRLKQALAPLAFEAWPYTGAIAILESRDGREERHLFRHWRYLGTARSPDEVDEILHGEEPDPPLDIDMYRLAVDAVRGGASVEAVE